MPNVGFSFLFVLAVLTLSGCAASKVQDKMAEPRSSIQSVSVGVGDFAPGVVQPAGAKSGKNATTGAIVGAAPGAAGMAVFASLCFNPITVGACAIAEGVYGLMAVAGGTTGAIYGESAGSMIEQAQRAISRILSVEAVQNTLVSRVVDYGSTATNLNFSKTATAMADDYHSDAVLEVAMMKVEGVEVKGGFFKIVSTHYALNMEARARLKRVSDGAVMAERTYRYIAAPHTPQEWTENEGKTLIATIDDGFRQLCEWIVDDFFLGQYADTRPNFPMPEAPPLVSGCIGFQHCTKRGLLAVPTDGLRPTLRWSFNAAGQKHSSVDAKETLPKVSYEVRVFSAHDEFNLWPMNIVYSRSGITDTSHTLEDDLAPCSYYIWTVRAMIDEDGKKRVTEWSGNYYKGLSPLYLRQLSASSTLHLGSQFNSAYPFSTPCEGKAMKQAVEIGNKMTTIPPSNPEMLKPTLEQSSSGSSSSIQSVTKLSTQEVISLPSVEGSFLGKEIKTTGLAGLVGGIDIKLSLTNKAEKDIAKVSGKVKLSDDSGNEIGSISFHAEKRIPSHGNIETTQTVYPILFLGYTKLKDVNQEKIKAVFTFESIEFSDGSKAKN
jgi:hypothetical protein